jgi:DNA polymerase III alpha subunit
LALRLGFRQIKSMRVEEADWIVAARGNGYTAVEDVWRRAGLEARTLTILAEADAFAALGLTRRDALWAAVRWCRRGSCRCLQATSTARGSWRAP